MERKKEFKMDGRNPDGMKAAKKRREEEKKDFTSLRERKGGKSES